MRLRPTHLLLLDLVGGFCYGVLAWALFGHDAEQRAAAVLGTLLASAAVVAARRRPVVAFVAALATFGLAPVASELSWVAVLPMTYVLWRAASDCPPRIAGTLLAASMAGAAATALPGWQHVGAVVPFALVFIAAWAVGHTVGQSRRYREALLDYHARMTEAELERARRGVVEERLRIARELHDVVAHSMSVITVQAGYGHLVSPGEPARARDALGAIESTGRRALVEMRQLLGVLRADMGSEQGAVDLHPVPSLAELDRLISDTAHAGVRVELTVTGEPRNLGPGVELCVYRIVQEALTNVVTHAGTPLARASIDYRPDEVVLEVTDEGNGRPVDVGVGHGLVGMRERAELCHGTIDARPLPHSGFQVTARLPIGASA